MVQKNTHLQKNVIWSDFGYSNIAFIIPSHFIILLFGCWIFSIPSECQTVWIQIKPNILSGLIKVQTVCKGYQQTTKVNPRGHICKYNTTCWYYLLSKTLAKVNYPHAFLKRRRRYCNRLRTSLTLSLPKPLDKIQPNLVCELLTWMGCATAHFFCHAPWGPGEGPKGQISLNIINFNYKVNFKDFLTKLCVSSHTRKI